MPFLPPRRPGYRAATIAVPPMSGFTRGAAPFASMTHGTVFIDGEPMKRATKRLAGSL